MPSGQREARVDAAFGAEEQRGQGSGCVGALHALRSTTPRQTMGTQAYVWQENPASAFPTSRLSEVGTKGEPRKLQARRFREQRKDLRVQQRASPPCHELPQG